MVLSGRVKVSIPAVRAGDELCVVQRGHSPSIRGHRGPAGAGGNVLALTHHHDCECSGPRAARLGKMCP